MKTKSSNVSTLYVWVPWVPFNGQRIRPRHLGVSSGGWCFALHVYPEEGINTLDDWMCLLEKPGSGIFDEYHRLVRLNVMLLDIKDRWCPPVERGEEFYRTQFGEPGPNGMIRHKIQEGRCIGHGPGPWDYFIGTF